MYSNEIQNLLEIRNYLLTVREYFYICETSPQIREISYNPFEDNFYINTDDRYKFKFKVKKEN